MRFIIALTVLSILIAPASALAMETKARNCAGGHPCQVIFTLDENNNIVLEDISGDYHRNEGVLRLTTEQAQKAAEGPVSKSNILSPKAREDEFSDTIRALASVPGLSFLKGESTGGKNTGSGTKSYGRLSQKCGQIKTVMEATLKDAHAGSMVGDQFITEAEVEAVCPSAKAQNLNTWYAKEKRQFLTQ